MATWALGMLFFVVLVGGGDNGGGGVVAVAVDHGDSPGSCGFPAIYTFGDNNSDTGQHRAMFADLDLPNGRTFFGESSGRFCDGRLMIDFIAEHLGFPLLSAYLNSYKTNFRHGANFALGGSSIRLLQSYSHFNLLRQVFQFAQFKSRTTTLYNQLAHDEKNQRLKNTLPRPEDFSKALFIIDIGQNDFAFDFQNSTVEEARKAIPAVVSGFPEAIFFLHTLYEAKYFWIHNVGPIGCLPYNVKSCQKIRPGCPMDPNGCVKDQNEVIQEFNAQLRAKVSELRAAYPNATFTYVDVYSAKYNLISNAKKLGFEDPMKFCCGNYNDQYVQCGRKSDDGTVSGTACNDPSKYISWDGIHYTEAANNHVAKLIVNGSLSDPPLPLAEACRKA